MDYKDYYDKAISTKTAVAVRDCSRAELIRAIMSCDSNTQAEIVSRVNAERYKKAAAKAVSGMKPKKRRRYSREGDRERKEQEKTKLVLTSILGKKNATRFINALSRRYGMEEEITLDFIKKNVSYSDALHTRSIGKGTADLARPILKGDQ